MAETDTIAKLAEIISNDLFARSFWGRSGSWNQNWPCENQRHSSRETHRSDVVFYYDEPYSLRRAYLNCDLKSYSSRRINVGVIQSALENLAQICRKAASLCAGHAQQFGGESPLPNLMEVKG